MESWAVPAAREGKPETKSTCRPASYAWTGPMNIFLLMWVRDLGKHFGLYVCFTAPQLVVVA